MNHHAGTPDAVAFIDQLDRSSEFAFADLHFDVTTRNSVYHVDDLRKTIAKNDGPARSGFVQGATFGGSMLMSGRLLVDAYMEFVMLDEGDRGKTYTSSLVAAIARIP